MPLFLTVSAPASAKDLHELLHEVLHPQTHLHLCHFLRVLSGISPSLLARCLLFFRWKTQPPLCQTRIHYYSTIDVHQSKDKIAAQAEIKVAALSGLFPMATIESHQ